jgi:hypothetical protein
MSLIVRTYIILLLLPAFNNLYAQPSREAEFQQFTKLVKGIKIDYSGTSQNYLETCWIVLTTRNDSVVSFVNFHADSSFYYSQINDYFAKKVIGYHFGQKIPDNILIPVLVGRLTNANVKDAIEKEKMFARLKKVNEVNDLIIYVHPVYLTSGIVTPPKKARKTSSE